MRACVNLLQQSQRKVKVGKRCWNSQRNAMEADRRNRSRDLVAFTTSSQIFKSNVVFVFENVVNGRKIIVMDR